MPNKPTVFSQRIAARLRGRAAMGHVTQAELGDLVGISQSQMSKVMLGKRVLTVDQLTAICHALGLSVTDVVQRAYDEAIGRLDFDVGPRILDDDGERL